MDNRLEFTKNGDKIPYQIAYVNRIKRATYNWNNYDNSDKKSLIKTVSIQAILFKHFLVQYFKIIIYYSKARPHIFGYYFHRDDLLLRISFISSLSIKLSITFSISAFSPV